MAIDRRNFIIGSAAMGLGAKQPLAAEARAGQCYAAARKSDTGNYSAAIFDPETGDLASVALPARGHDIAFRPGTRECVVFARRPGSFAIAFSTDPSRPPDQFRAGTGRHFFGHGAFSPDGRLLFTTENDFDRARGMIGVRDATGGYRQIGEFYSGGTGPHDLGVLSDGRTLVVANGGIETHPETGRRALNLDTMSPSLSYIDSQTGDILETLRLAPSLHHLSIRHLTIAAHDRIVFGCQHKGPKWQRPPLVGMHQRGGDIELIRLPTDITRAMQNYVASIEADRDGDIVLASAPRGAMAVAIDLRHRRFIGKYMLRDVSGIAPSFSGSTFYLTSGNGKIARYDPAAVRNPAGLLKTSIGYHWDNHLARCATK